MTKLWTPGDRDRQWQLGYNNLYSIINDSSLIIMPLGDPRYFAGSGTFKTTGDIQATFTPSSDPRTWATPYNHTQDSSYTPGGLIPQLTFDGSANEFDSPDADAWSFGADGTAPNEPSISWGIWVNIPTAGTTMMMTKAQFSPQVGEWRIFFRSGAPTINLQDNSISDGVIGLKANSAIVVNTWNHLGFTYDGSTANTGMKIYVNGASVATTSDNNSSYTAMENTSAIVMLAHQLLSGSPNSLLNGSLAGASCSPWIVGKELTADEVNRIYRMQHSQIHGYYP